MTKQERAEYMREYRQKNREQINSNARYYYKQNKERLAEKNRENAKRYYDSHKGDPEFIKKQREAHKRYVEKNREKWNAYNRELYHRRAEEYRMLKAERSGT